MEQNYRGRTLKSLLLAWASYRKGNRDEAEQRLSEIVNWWQSEGETLNSIQSNIAAFLLSNLAPESEGSLAIAFTSLKVRF